MFIFYLAYSLAQCYCLIHDVFEWMGMIGSFCSIVAFLFTLQQIIGIKKAIDRQPMHMSFADLAVAEGVAKESCNFLNNKKDWNIAVGKIQDLSSILIRLMTNETFINKTKTDKTTIQSHIGSLAADIRALHSAMFNNEEINSMLIINHLEDVRSFCSTIHNNSSFFYE